MEEGQCAGEVGKENKVGKYRQGTDFKLGLPEMTKLIFLFYSKRKWTKAKIPQFYLND